MPASELSPLPPGAVDRGNRIRVGQPVGNRPSELETKFLLLCLFGMGALATWAGSEAVLPASAAQRPPSRNTGNPKAVVSEPFKDR